MEAETTQEVVTIAQGKDDGDLDWGSHQRGGGKWMGLRNIMRWRPQALVIE